jgi:hypothetical protein
MKTIDSFDPHLSMADRVFTSNSSPSKTLFLFDSCSTSSFDPSFVDVTPFFELFFELFFDVPISFGVGSAGFGCRAILLSASERWGGRFSEKDQNENKVLAVSQN